jgi:hypothetical protein
MTSSNNSITTKKLFLFNLCILLFFNIFILISTEKLHANAVSIKSWLYYDTQKSFVTNKSSTLTNSFSLQVKAKKKNISSNFTLNALDENKIIFDQSYIEYNYKKTTFGIGKIDRHWSFSPRTSLILSNNTRPGDSIYVKFINETNTTMLLNKPWSLEAFNSILSNNTTEDNVLLLGIKAAIKPLKNLTFEFYKTSQWGGDKHKNDFSTFTAALLSNTNNGENSNINQMADFGFSYDNKTNKIPFTIYGQIVGEDEAGNLPSCNMHLFGSELQFKNSQLGAELVDTRIDLTEHGNFGSNTAYNNNTYKYINYDQTIGAPIDTESISISIWGNTKTSVDTKLNYSIEKITINSSNWVDHRLTSSRQDGFIATFGAQKTIGSTVIQGNLAYQNFFLDKFNVPKGLSLRLNANYNF